MNGARHLAETLNSILAQEHVHFDLLISDDHSEDETLALAASLIRDRGRIVANPHRLGLAGNWNQCVALSRTPLLAIIHQDDRLHPSHLAAHVAAFRDPSVGLVASASLVIDDAGIEVPPSIVERGGLGLHNHLFAPREALPALARSNPLRCSAVSLRVAAHAQAGGFDPAFRYVVDWDLWLRLAQHWSLAWLATPSVDVRWHQASETHRFKQGLIDLQETEQVLHAALALLESSPAQTRSIASAAHHRLARAYLNRAHTSLRGGDGPLAKSCLKKAVSLSPSILRSVASDPPLAAQMAAVWLSPKLSGSLFRRSEIDPATDRNLKPDQD